MQISQLKTKTQYKLNLKCVDVKWKEGQNLLDFLILWNYDKE